MASESDTQRRHILVALLLLGMATVTLIPNAMPQFTWVSAVTSPHRVATFHRTAPLPSLTPMSYIHDSQLSDVSSSTSPFAASSAPSPSLAWHHYPVLLARCIAVGLFGTLFYHLLSYWGPRSRVLDPLPQPNPDYRTTSYMSMGAVGVVETEATDDKQGTMPKDDQGWASLSRYDWLRQWYPMAWCSDLPPGVPHKLTLFDTDYVVVRSASGAPPMAFLDCCPHRLAALSEGRVTNHGLLQCAYHGWTFDAQGTAYVPHTSSKPGGRCATPIPCRERHGLLWIVPDPSCKSPDEEGVPPPAVPAEFTEAKEGWQLAEQVRDLPADYCIVLENLIDFDHGVFAHYQKNFDLYSGDPLHPQEVEVQHYDPITGQQFMIQMKTPAVFKLIAKSNKDAKPSTDATKPPLMATSTFVAPVHVQTCRRDPETGATTFLTFFWAVPTGVGRCRLLLGSYAKLPFSLPKWLSHVFLNGFLDEDTHLLATEQQYVLSAEFAAAARGENLRRTRLYSYASPGEKLLSAVGRFLDATVPLQPRRYAKLSRNLPSDVKAADLEHLFMCPPREVTLDRFAQHTAICPSSQGALANARKVATFATVLAALTLGHVGLMMWSAGLAAGLSGLLDIAKSHIMNIFAGALFAIIAGMAQKLTTQFYYVYRPEDRDRHLARIPTLVPDIA